MDSRRRRDLADEFLAAQSSLKQRFAADMPADLREQLEGITIHQCEALVRVVQEGGITMNDVSRRLGISLSSCTPLIDRLQRQGLVERASDPADRRVVRVVPTERGQHVVDRFLGARRQTMLRLLSALDDEQAATFVRLATMVARGEDR